MPPIFNWLDFVTLLILCLCAVDGLAKGFVLSVFKTVGFFVAIFAARALTPMCASLITANANLYSSIDNIFKSKSTASSSVDSVLKILSVSNADTGSVLTTTFISVMAFIIVFILIKLLLSILAGALNMGTKLPVIKQFNKLGGFCFGLIKGVFIIFLVFAGLTVLAPLLSSDNSIAEVINNSFFASNFYKYNIILLWLKSVIV